MNPAAPTLDLLAPYRTAGLLAASDVHVAEAVCRLSDEHRPDVILAAALAARAPRLSHVCVDLRHVSSDTELADAPEALAWPESDSWIRQVADSPLVDGPQAPLVLDGSMLYLQRFHRYEQDVAALLLRLASASVVPLNARPDVVGRLLGGEGSDVQRFAVDTALARALTVLVGGPGTGKTTTVAAVLATLAASNPTLHIALAAPTGKAAARLGEALREAAEKLPAELAAVLAQAEASTLHRLLGVRGGTGSGFHHHHRHPLPHDVVIVDETSMVSLPLMAALLDAVRPDARLILVGDPDQLVSVEAGSVLGDIAGPVLDAQMSLDTKASTNDDVGLRSPIAEAVVVLHVSRRFPPGSPIERLAVAVRAGNASDAVAVLSEGDESLDWQPHQADHPPTRNLVLDLAAVPTLLVAERADAGDADGALAVVEAFRLLCAHREGPFGVHRWNQLIEQTLAKAGRSTTGWYAGRPVLVTRNDYGNGLYNGDLGVVIRAEPRSTVAFPAAHGTRTVNPSRLTDIDTVHATTIHKSQGSEFDHVVVLLPPPDSPLSSRELLYTAITRARARVTVVGSEAAVRAAVERHVGRPGGLRSALWSTGHA